MISEGGSKSMVSSSKVAGPSTDSKRSAYLPAKNQGITDPGSDKIETSRSNLEQLVESFRKSMISKRGSKSMVSSSKVAGPSTDSKKDDKCVDYFVDENEDRASDSSTTDEDVLQHFFETIDYREPVVFPQDVKRGIIANVINDDAMEMARGKTFYDYGYLSRCAAISVHSGVSYGGALMTSKGATRLKPIPTLCKTTQEYLGRLAVLAIKRFNIMNHTHYRCVALLEARIKFDAGEGFLLKFTAAEDPDVKAEAFCAYVSDKVYAAGGCRDVFFCCLVEPEES